MPVSPSTHATPLPRLAGSDLVVGPPEQTRGAWAGGPSAVEHDGEVLLAYRLRRPLGEGRGFANVVARWSPTSGLEPLVTLSRDAFGADSLERPCLVRTPEGRWRLYVSAATPGTKHWRVDLLEADTPKRLADAQPTTVLPGDAQHAVKDPVIVHAQGRWHLWASVHPLESWHDADRMTTDYATSPDGIDWSWHGTVLAGRPGSWDARGVRVSSVLLDADRVVATYDGRATAEENWEEVTGVAHGALGADGLFGAFTSTSELPLRGPEGSGSLRYLCGLTQPEGAVRWFYEVARADGAHELRTELVAPPRP